MYRHKLPGQAEVRLTIHVHPRELTDNSLPFVRHFSMHYRHHFHAGNFADVFKHVLQVGLLDSLSRKDKPWAFVDTHAGEGAYSLAASSSQGVGQEWQNGVGRFESAMSGEPIGTVNVPAMVARYWAVLQAAGFSSKAGRAQYPGSPILASLLARTAIGDRLVLCEKLEPVADQLRETMRFAHARAQIHHRDGYEASSLLPPFEKRGLVLVDPPFEQPGEFDAVADFLVAASARFASGVYAVWYPAKDQRVCNQFVRRVRRETARPALDFRIDTGGEAKTIDANGIVKHRMTACGMLVINPPFGFDAAAREALAWLAPVLAQGASATWSVLDE